MGEGGKQDIFSSKQDLRLLNMDRQPPFGSTVPLVGLLGKTQQHASAKTGSYNGERCLGGDMEACAEVMTTIRIHMCKRNECVAFADILTEEIQDHLTPDKSQNNSNCRLFISQTRFYQK